MSVIEVVGLVREFGSARAVDDVSFSVNAGEVVGLLGPNGAGKTTTLRLLAGLLKPTSGSARIAGHDAHADGLAARRQLGFLTASTGLYERLTGREVLRTFGALQGLSDAQLDARVETVSRELELTAFLDKRCGAMSSGQKQRISIGRAVVHEPLACVLDEPTATLDPIASREVLDFVSGIRAAGKAVLFSTHRMEEAQEVCTRLLVMREGKIVAQGSLEDILRTAGQPTLSKAFLALAGVTV
jgi:sodium transport system ATP-binding protein